MTPGKRATPVEAGAAATTVDHAPTAYTRPLPLRARHLRSVSWWLRDQPWCEEHLRNLAAAWSRVYGERAA
jgi:hypothetical protein